MRAQGKDARPYVVVHDDIVSHPKYAGLSDAAKVLLIEAWCWLHRQNRDGAVPDAVWSTWKTARARAQLIERGWFVQEDGHVRAHDYEKHQQVRADRERLSEIRAEAGRRGGIAKAAKQTASKGLAAASDLPQLPDVATVAKSKQSLAEVEVEVELLASVPASAGKNGGLILNAAQKATARSITEMAYAAVTGDRRTQQWAVQRHIAEAVVRGLDPAVITAAVEIQQERGHSANFWPHALEQAITHSAVTARRSRRGVQEWG